MRKIAIIDLTFNWPPVGGCWVDIKEIAQRLPGLGYEVKLFVPDWNDYYLRGVITTELPFPVEKIPFNRFSFNGKTASKKFRKAISNWGADLVYFGDGYQLKGSLLKAFSDYPTILRFYSYELMCLNLHYWLYDQNRVCDGNFLTDPDRCHKCWFPGNAFVKRLCGIILGVEDRHPKLHFSQEYIFTGAHGKKYREELKKSLGLPRKIIVYNDFTKKMLEQFNPNIEIITSGVDSKHFVPAPVRPPDDIKKILMTGRTNDPLKGFGTVLEACNKLREKRKDFELLVTAAMNLEFQEPYVKNLGWVPPEKLPAIYQQGHISLVPSLWVEPFGITAAESMSAGVPVIASKIGGLAKSTIDGETGILFEPGNAGELAEALEKLLDNPELRKKMGEAGRKRAETVFDWDVIVEKYYKPMLDEILG